MTDHELLVFIAEKVVSVETQIGSLDTQIHLLQAQIESLETRMKSLETRMDSLEARMDSLEARMDSLETRVDSLETRMDSLEKEVRRNSMLIENEILPRLQTIEKLYVDSSNIFMTRSMQIEQLQDDVDVLKIVVEDHSCKLEKIS